LLGECSPFTNLSTVNDPSGSTITSFIWNFGDGGVGLNFDENNCYADTGSYDVTLTITSNFGCKTTITKNSFVTVNPLPVANFDYSPKPVIPFGQVLIEDLSKNAITYLYSSTDGQNFVTPNPIFRFLDTGRYYLQQHVTNVFGCVDSILKLIHIKGEVKVFLPNAFTPNNDGDNDVFRPVLFNVSRDHYKFMIFNRWGEIVFETSDVSKSWDGKHNGVLVPTGVYVWSLVFKDQNSYSVSRKRGHVNVLK